MSSINVAASVRMRRLTATAAAAIMACVAACSPAADSKSAVETMTLLDRTESAVERKIHDFGVSRYSGVPLTENDADLILAQASAILATPDGPGDVPCSVTMRREGPVSTFTTARGNIITRDELNAVLAQPGSVHVVAFIGACGKQRSGINGCAPIPGGDLAVVRIDAAAEGALWAHEFGHNQGLTHRIGDLNVMNNGASSRTREVDSTECAAFKQDRSQSLNGAPLPTSTSTGATTAVAVFVRQTYFDGVPFADASRFTVADLPALNAVLSNPNDSPYWDNAVGVMGAIGGPSATETLIQFVRRNEDKSVNGDTLRASLSAMIGLGYSANKGNKAALDFLIERAGQLPATTPSDTGFLQLDDFSINQSAVLALSLTGQARADQVLQSLPGNLEVVRNAREMSAEVRLKGLQGYDRSN